jgi:hypothetical protein
MQYKFVSCQNPITPHLKVLYGEFLNKWLSLKCECGYEFDTVADTYEEIYDVESNFNNVQSEEDTKILPSIKVKITE